MAGVQRLLTTFKIRSGKRNTLATTSHLTESEKHSAVTKTNSYNVGTKPRWRLLAAWKQECGASQPVPTDKLFLLPMSMVRNILDSTHM